MKVYYNDSDAFVCAWLRNLITAKLLPAGDVDERPIEQVQASDLAGYDQCHFFAGIGGWPYALQFAGWGDRPVWTGSCPCQPFSQGGRGAGAKDPRHLWPVWRPLIAQCRPPTVFGEQVSGLSGLSWCDLVAHDLEDDSYAFAAADLPVACLDGLHTRHRLWWVAVADSNADSLRREGLVPQSQHEARQDARFRSGEFTRLVSDSRQLAIPAGSFGAVADGVSARTPKLRAYGNAIVPQVAAAFVKAYMDVAGLGMLLQPLENA